ncbi:hypothetical protein NW841_12245 [Synechococcus sp. H60.3]
MSSSQEFWTFQTVEDACDQLWIGDGFTNEVISYRLKNLFDRLRVYVGS